MVLRVVQKMQGAFFKFLQNIEQKDLLIMELKKLRDCFESCRMLR